MLVEARRSARAYLTLIVLLSAISTAQKPPNKADRARWNAMIPQIKAELERNKMSCDYEGGWQIGVAGIEDLTGDGVPEALIDWCHGGAYTDSLVLMRLEGSKPVLARFLQQDGNHGTPEFLDGSSVMHSCAAEMHPEKHAIYDVKVDSDRSDEDGRVLNEQRVVDVYVWNAKTKTFDWNAAMSREQSLTSISKR